MNRFICEKVMGQLWHDIHRPDSTGPDKAALMDFAVEQGWWEDFKDWSWEKAPANDNDWVAYLWRNLARLIAEYHGWKEEK